MLLTHIGKGKITVKGSGYKPFKRWAHHWQDYLREDGTIAPPAVLWEAWEKQGAESQQAPLGVPDENTINWSNLGPGVVTTLRFLSADKVV